jgi:hypothetical protein
MKSIGPHTSPNNGSNVLQAHAKYGNQWAFIAKLPGLEGR